MRNYSPLKFKFCYRAFLLFGVLAGLLFSAGEGIRLIPFPLSEIGHQAKLNVYQKNVHRFEDQKKSELKSQREIPPNHWAGNFASLNFTPVYTAAADLARHLSNDVQTAKPIEVGESCGSRAPPVSETV